MNQPKESSSKGAIVLTLEERRRLWAMFSFIALLHISGALLMCAATSGPRNILADG